MDFLSKTKYRLRYSIFILFTKRKLILILKESEFNVEQYVLDILNHEFKIIYKIKSFLAKC